MIILTDCSLQFRIRDMTVVRSLSAMVIGFQTVLAIRTK